MLDGAIDLQIANFREEPTCHLESSVLLWATLLLLPAVVHAAEEAPKSPEWYEYIVGVLAIPATLIRLAYSYVLIKKTHIESRKIKLEIIEKENALSAQDSISKQEQDKIIASLIKDSIVTTILLRFALLYVTLQLWSLAVSAFGLIMGGAFLGLQSFELLGDFTGWHQFALFMVSQLPQIATWVIILTLGLPLLKDISGYLGVSGLSLFRMTRSGQG